MNFHIFIQILCFKIFFYFNTLDLGVGWAAAVADDPTELQFYQENNRISTDHRSYWIGGLGYETLESEGYSEGRTIARKHC